MTGTVYFIGAGPGAPDLLTVRAERLIGSADVVIYADSLVHPDVARLARSDARVEASSRLTLEQMSALMIQAARDGMSVARLHSGDPSVYGALFEQIVRLREADIQFEIVPGVSSAFVAAALLEAELTVPGVSQTVIMTRAAGRTGALPDGEELRDLARHQASLALFLSGALLRSAVPELIEGGYPAETPAALVYRATWEDQRLIRGPLSQMADLAHAAGITKQALLMVGRALDPEHTGDADRRSHLYDPEYSHGRRIARIQEVRRRFPQPLPGGEGAPAAISPGGPLSFGEGAGVRKPRTPKEVAILAVSRPGAGLAERLAAALPSTRIEKIDFSAGGLRGTLERLWNSTDSIIMVMAAGAAVRLIAPLLSDKRTDPGVVVVDDAGRFAVSLLGGHRSDANGLAARVAEAIGAQAVTTTAAEALGVPSIESLARQHGWVIENDGLALTRLAAAIVNGEPFGVFSDTAIESWWPGPIEQLVPVPTFAALSEADVDVALLVTDRAVPREYWSNLDHWVLARPSSLVVGVGCSSDAPSADVEALLASALEQAGLSPLSVAMLTTLDRRADEPAIRALAERLGCEVRAFTSDQLASVPVPTPSAVVREAVGTPSVCEAAALLGSGADSLLLTKRKNPVATVAIARLGARRR